MDRRKPARPAREPFFLGIGKNLGDNGGLGAENFIEVIGIGRMIVLMQREPAPRIGTQPPSDSG